MIKIKICGLTDTDSAIAAAKVGADFIGIVYAASKRQVTTERASQIVQAVRKLKKPPLIVGVFVNLPAAEINSIAEYCKLDLVQLSGDESWSYCLDIERPFINVIHIGKYQSSSKVLSEIEEGCKVGLKQKHICLLDTKIGNVYGGSGKVFDWRLVEEISSKYPLILAGGLSSENVRRLVKQVNPWGVDVSSGVESGGKKDIQKINAFIQDVRQAEKEVGLAT